jgi:hypothetical protein
MQRIDGVLKIPIHQGAAHEMGADLRLVVVLQFQPQGVEEKGHILLAQARKFKFSRFLAVISV